MNIPQAGSWGNVKNMFALIIGIDDYSHARKLKGAVADADRFESFLTARVGVKNNRIITLRNKNATREAIVGAFRSLWEHRYIQHGNPILIFYAGHGCEMPRPKYHETGGQKSIQAICPCDMKLGDPSKPAVYPIPDFTIAIWLNVLSREKGNNITVIFDCCHSAGGTRVAEQNARCLEFDGSFPCVLDDEHADAIKVLGEVQPNDMIGCYSRSHVLLAACSATEYAREENGEGLFTTELLRVLEEPGVDRLSFYEFMSRLKAPTGQNNTCQTPQCYGHFKDRLLFSNLLKHRSGVFPVSWEHESQAYRIDAGRIHGVDVGSIFNMYKTAAVDTMARNPLCTLTAQEVYPFYTIAAINEAKVKRPGVPGVACQVCGGKALKIYFTSAFLAVVRRDDVLSLYDIHRKVKVEADRARADFIIDMEGMDVVFTVNLTAVAGHGPKRLPDSVPAEPDRISRVILAASRWKQHLDASCDDHSMAGDVDIEFYLLEQSYKKGRRWVFKLKGNKLNRRTHLSQRQQLDNSVSLHVKPGNKDLYGMKIQNNTDENFHLSILTFEVGSLSITSRTSGSIGVHSDGDADPILLSRDFLPYGYGNSGETPLHFKPHGANASVTILKFYFTTNPMDLKWLEQPSPFADTRAGDFLTSRAETQKLLESPDDIGFSKLLKIEQVGDPS